jgi:hypothetical protein
VKIFNIQQKYQNQLKSKEYFNKNILIVLFNKSSGCSYKSIDVSCVSDAFYRTFDGTCNNLLTPWWGSTNIPFRRLMKATYADGMIQILNNRIKFLFLGEFLPRHFSVLGTPLASPREISNICSHEIDNLIEHSINSFFTAFAQFIGHDLSSTANGRDDKGNEINCECKEEIKNPFCLNIPTPDMSDQLCMLVPRSSASFQRDMACQLCKLILKNKRF